MPVIPPVLHTFFYPLRLQNAMEQKLISRRHFMKRMAGASLLFPVPHIISRTVLGRGPFPAASDRITLAHIGVGGRGTSLMNSFLRIPGTQSVAVCHPFQEKREEAARVLDRYKAEIRDRSAF